ncbi:N-acetylmuramoyl-L-alanine amidase [Actinoplanes lobatus]|uniref:N-acetylmuramoyl-L-alanine amidase n=1 Tax=Actinoplanes lobatus TaxID=113568 RepID=A0A7W7HC88_9ACTN|nr:N-acetylmuramoyl-L-alanine amidase [Actinoplanes lobatus]MBB4747891.1 N-acetylmuramoyl-L-alanine amidase [Actinoplanes lobatus]GGN89508.1 N-acetylmuramoyl-L-alanine amidase [Actinoplanes lobatus]GIE43678.1 N-acetylmuramoyl-L-alanine amidase [Actinoplanes lobatus]
MRSIRRGDTGPAVSEIRSILVGLELLDEAEPDVFDEALETAVRAFQQNRGLGVDGMVGDETWGALDAARWRLGSRTLFHSVPDALVGEDVRALQERLLEMGYDTGRPDAVYGARTARAVAQFQREIGLVQDGSCGPQTMKALRRLGRKVVGGRPQWLREAEAFRQSGPNLVGKTIVIDPGHGGGDDTGVLVPDGPLRWNEADLVFDLASRLEGRLSAAGMRVHLTRGPSPAAPMSGAERAALANSLGADLLISLHLDGHTSDAAEGVATYHYGTGNGLSSTVGERLAALVQREIVVRAGMHDCRTHAKTWDLLRLTRMPTVRVDLGYLTSPTDRERLIDPMFREQIVEALLAAVQRMYFPVERDVPTGSIDVRQLRLALADKN